MVMQIKLIVVVVAVVVVVMLSSTYVKFEVEQI